MAYEDNQFKYILALFGKEDTGKLINAGAHALAGLQDKLSAGHFLPYQSKDDLLNANISKWPVIVLKAKQRSHLKSLYKSSVELDIPVNPFTHEMIGISADIQRAQTKEKTMDDASFLAVACFCQQEQLSDITKKMSLFR